MSDLQAITGATKVVAVWGHPVSHSRSPGMHNAALGSLGLDWVYVPFDVDPNNIETAVAAVRALGIVGVNITVPLKQVVLPYLDDIDADAQAVGSVNTICNFSGQLRGASTDGPGFLRALAASGEETSNRHAYLLGAGGSARAVAFALARQGGEIQIANRDRARAAGLAMDVNALYPGAATVAECGERAAPFDILINATSLGMSPNIDTCAILPTDAFRGRPFVCDLVYAPPETRLLREARSAGCNIANGIGMLVFQGALSLSMWTGVAVDDLPIDLMTANVERGLGISR